VTCGPSPAEPDQYFARGIVELGAEEVIVDCGAFTGDTLTDAASRLGSWRAYHAFEPDPASYAQLELAVARAPPGSGGVGASSPGCYSGRSPSSGLLCIGYPRLRAVRRWRADGGLYPARRRARR